MKHGSKGQTEAEIGLATFRLALATIGGTAMARIIAIAAAASDFHFAAFGAMRICNGFLRDVTKPIPTPFADVAVHIAETPCVRLTFADDVRLVAGIVFVPCDVFEIGAGLFAVVGRIHAMVEGG